MASIKTLESRFKKCLDFQPPEKAKWLPRQWFPALASQTAWGGQQLFLVFPEAYRKLNVAYNTAA